MTELEKLKSAKDYMEKLSNGIDPVSDEVLPEDTVLNNVDLSRCFFYLSDVLRRLIESNDVVVRQYPKKVQLKPFALPDEMRTKIEITERPAMIRQFTDRINTLVDDTVMQKLKVTALTTWLADNGFLYEEIISSKKRKRPTKAGEELGIFSELHEGRYGGYLAILYKESAQRYIVSNLDQIIAISNGVECA